MFHVVGFKQIIFIGIEKKKKTRLVWDDVVKNWIPRYGYKKVQAEEEKNWMMEYKVNCGLDHF